jgi:putative ABC transport system substrate-binding protein
VRRRDFIGALAGSVVWPITAHGQQQASSEAAVAGQISAFRRGLNETGFTEGRNVAIEYRWAEGQYSGCRLWRLNS